MGTTSLSLLSFIPAGFYLQCEQIAPRDCVIISLTFRLGKANTEEAVLLNTQ